MNEMMNGFIVKLISSAIRHELQGKICTEHRDEVIASQLKQIK